MQTFGEAEVSKASEIKFSDLIPLHSLYFESYRGQSIGADFERQRHSTKLAYCRDIKRN